jgi:hypothetical protein
MTMHDFEAKHWIIAAAVVLIAVGAFCFFLVLAGPRAAEEVTNKPTKTRKLCSHRCCHC